MGAVLKPSNADALRQYIEDAFADMVYPGDQNIATNPNHCDECSETDDFFKDKHWQELSGPNQKLQTGWGGLSFLSPPAWRYFMPAYLIVGISDGEHSEDAAWSALYALSPGMGDLADYFQERASGFSAAQQDCLAAYTAAFSEMEPEDETYQAAALYWKEKAASQAL